MEKIVKLIINILAAYRLAEMVVEDDGPYDIFKRFRVWAGQNAHKSSTRLTIANGVNCIYCVGFWMAILVFLLPKKLDALKTILAISGGQSFLTSRRFDSKS